MRTPIVTHRNKEIWFHFMQDKGKVLSKGAELWFVWRHWTLNCKIYNSKANLTLHFINPWGKGVVTTLTHAARFRKGFAILVFSCPVFFTFPLVRLWSYWIWLIWYVNMLSLTPSCRKIDRIRRWKSSKLKLFKIIRMEWKLHHLNQAQVYFSSQDFKKFSTLL